MTVVLVWAADADGGTSQMDMGALVAGDATLECLNEVLERQGWPRLGGAFDIFAPLPEQVPDWPGVYVFCLADAPLRYPNGHTRVNYLGAAFGAAGLWGRLVVHQDLAAKCRRNADNRIFYPRYEWVNAAGGVCLYSPLPGHLAGGAKQAHGAVLDMECWLIEAFRSTHYTLPMGNGQRGRAVRSGAIDVTKAEAA